MREQIFMLPFFCARVMSLRSFVVFLSFLCCVVLAACGGGGSSSSSSSTSTTSNNSNSSGSGSDSGTTVATSTIAAAASNVATITVAQGPNASFANLPFVTVKVCAVGTTTCDTVSNVLLDSGSVGLRLMSSTLTTSLSSMTHEQTGASYLNECGAFVSGYTWGTVRLADVTIGSETAPSVPIQVIGDAAAGSTAPSDCISAYSSTNLSTANALGANGILGVAGLALDCGPTCVTIAKSAYYYACTSTGGGCTATTAAASLQVSNVANKLPTDNNGVIIEMPQISTSGATSVTGALVFGIGTQSNNALGDATVLQTDNGFDFKSTYKGVTYSDSFVDSGSNYLFFYDGSLTRCSTLTKFYCPSTTTSETATFTPTNGGSTYAASFSVANAETLFNTSSYAYNNIAGYQNGGSSLGMDFGMPFFYGKNVFVKIETTSGAADGYLAFIANTN